MAVDMYDSNIKEYDLNDLDIIIPSIELMTSFSNSSTGKDFYIGKDLRGMFNLSNDTLKVNGIYVIEVDLLELVINIKNGKEVEYTLNFMELGYTEQVDIVKNIMDNSSKKFLVSYLGNIIKR